MSLNLSTLKEVNGRYFSTYANGGYGKKPIMLDDSVSTDQVAARINEYPSMVAKSRYFSQDSEFYNFQNRRLQTGYSQIPNLQERGINILGMDGYGRINQLAVQPNSAAMLSSADSQTGWILSALVITGFVILILNALSPDN